MGRYLPVWPVFIVGDHPSELSFTVALDDARILATASDHDLVGEPEARRQYVTAMMKRRIHQQAFRERVLRAYREQCALCRLKHSSLLDAAHIIPDSEPEGVPVIPNGLALCKLHHAAYDQQFIGIRPDYVVEVRPSILEEEDGPMLLHGLKEMHLQNIQLPRSKANRPNPKHLDWRYSRFLAP